MGPIYTIKECTSGLVVNSVKGKIVIKDFLDWIMKYYHDIIDSKMIWDLTEADVSGISPKEIKIIAKAVKNIIPKSGGKTAIVASKDISYGLGRVYMTHIELEEVPINVNVFRNVAEAKEWLEAYTNQP